MRDICVYIGYPGPVPIIGRGIATTTSVSEMTAPNQRESQVANCEELERLRQRFVDAFRELAEMQAQQTEAIIQRDPDFTRFDDLIYMARLAKDHAKYALLAHLDQHKCQDQH